MMNLPLLSPKKSSLRGIKNIQKTVLNFALILCFFFLAAQQNSIAQVANYTFTSTAGTYSSITGTTLIAVAWDDNYLAPVSLPFTFVYNQVSYTTVGVNTNGYITMGGSSNPTSNACGLQNGGCSPNSIAAYASDLQGSSTSSITYTTTGVTPNRKFIVQWNDCDHYGNNFTDHWNFQIVLNETSNTVQVIWGICTAAVTMGANACSYGYTESGDCGLLGSSAGDFNLRAVTNGTNTFATSVAGTTIADVCNMSPTNVPPTGLTYTWTAPAPTPMVYISSTTNFLNNALTVAQNSVNNKILQIQVVTTGTLAPITVSSFALSTLGCTNAGADIVNAKIYYTGVSSTFVTTTLFGTAPSPNGSYTINGSAVLNSSVNYFWVTYDITPTAGFGDLLKGCCNQITGSGSMGTQTPTVTCPVGSQSINIPQGSWAPVITPAPHLNGGVMLLLSDGTVMCKTAAGVDGYGNLWDRLTPDIHGSYVNGTWSSMSPMINTRLFFSTQVLKDGRVYVAGGEYGSGGASAEVYNPLADSWTACPSIGHTISDANSEILPDGKVLQGMVTFDSSWNLAACKVYDPIANTYSAPVVGHGMHNESTWVKLADNSILYVDRDQVTSERFIPSLNQWVVDGILPVSLYDSYGSESGPAFLLPDGRAFFLGATQHTAYYTPSGNASPGIWVAGPDMPNLQGMPDAAGAMMVNGKILIAVSPVPTSSNHFPQPTTFYVFDYLTNTYSIINAPDGNVYLPISCYVTNMLDLPDGSVLYSQQQESNSSQYYIFTPYGAPLAAGKPTINTISQSSCDSFKLTGTLFNGISEGAVYGDDWQNESNYPIVRLTSGANVYYCRTYNWNRTSVMTGNLPDTVHFTLPAGLPHGIYSLRVIANGNPSDSIQFIPFPILTSNLHPNGICSGTAFSYTPVAIPNGATISWTRPAITGISNAEVLIPQFSNPNETLINTTTSPIAVTYIFALTTNNCSDTINISVVVNPNPTPTITPNGPTTFCFGNSVTLNAGNYTSYFWNTNATTNSISASVSFTYTITVTDSNGCTGTASQAVIVNQLPVPVINHNGPTTFCIGDSVTLNVSPNFSSFHWSNNATTNTISVLTNGPYTITVSDNNGCTGTSSQSVIVNPLPQVSFTGLPDTICVNAPNRTLIGSPAGGNYVGSGVIAGIFYPNLAALGNDPIHYSFTDTNGCANTFVKVINVQLCSGIDQINAIANGLSIYPNPANGAVSIQFSSNRKEIISINLMDVAGRTILAQNEAAAIGENHYLMNLSGIAEGIYLITLQTKDALLKAKVVIQ